MGTRSAIGVKENGVYKMVYCHWDGYVENNGAVLYYYYNNLNRVKELIELGALSSLGKEIAPPEGQAHNFDNPILGVTVAYYRDRKTDLRPATEFNSLKDIEWGEFSYYFDKELNEWYVQDRETNIISKLEDKLAEFDFTYEKVEQFWIPRD